MILRLENLSTPAGIDPGTSGLRSGHSTSKPPSRPTHFTYYPFNAAVTVYPLGALGPDKLDLTRFSGYKFRSASTKGPRRSSAPGPE
ncbi:hypothetical protein TNCV_2537241 [Trichonephila clavipes]|nr:hypothetical protein TNCV_2537241 [Trichonephila clavipes]